MWKYFHFPKEQKFLFQLKQMPENLQLLLLVTASWLWSVLDALEKEIYILHTKCVVQSMNKE